MEQADAEMDPSLAPIKAELDGILQHIHVH